MGLTDILNKLPMKVVSEVVKETGKSRYSLAQVCNSAAAMPSIIVAIDANHNNDTSGVFVGGGWALLNILFTFYNQSRKQHENPSFIDKRVEELTERYPIVNKAHLRKDLENRLLKQDQAEIITKKSGLYYNIFGIVMAVAAYRAYGTLVEHPNEQLSNYAFYATLLSPSMMLTGVAHYFRAVRPKQV